MPKLFPDNSLNLTPSSLYSNVSLLVNFSLVSYFFLEKMMLVCSLLLLTNCLIRHLIYLQSQVDYNDVMFLPKISKVQLWF